MLDDKKKAERISPIKTPPHRQAGQSLDEEVNQILNEEVGASIAVLVAGVLFIALEWGRLLLDFGPHPIQFTVGFAIVAAYLIRHLLTRLTMIKNMRLGSEGEKIVGELLEKSVRKDGFAVFHDIVGDGFNIDHVVIGPPGAFTIETKTRRKPLRGSSEIMYDGEIIEINGFRDTEILIQARAQSHWLKDCLKGLVGHEIPVRPVVLFPGWFVERARRGVEVWVLNEKALSTFLTNETGVLDADEVSSIANQFSRYLRDRH